MCRVNEKGLWHPSNAAQSSIDALLFRPRYQNTPIWTSGLIDHAGIIHAALVVNDKIATDFENREDKKKRKIAALENAEVSNDNCISSGHNPKNSTPPLPVSEPRK